ncbi:rod-binding protein [Enterovirga rhinocerotis]|uniref:Rod binding protein n=1 Tax=Enterovirga rhinocerotis TaxID=1339210 RepID=A0A4R7C7B8_9HYPH|nr:rod-binding protein [Enterovirga rhinocerotis]TDR93145.1 rod binding protein [Enterovirga rhinocerotis]
MVAPLAMIGLSIAGDVASGIATDLVKSVASAGQKDKIKKTAQDFETMFLEQALERLTENAGDAGPLGGGHDGGGVYRSMLVKEYAGEIVKSGGVGIADSVYRQMLKLQEG